MLAREDEEPRRRQVRVVTLQQHQGLSHPCHTFPLIPGSAPVCEMHPDSSTGWLEADLFRSGMASRSPNLQVVLHLLEMLPGQSI